VVTLYDPASLQVRTDVRFENVPQVRPGQPVRIETAAAPGGALKGEVLFATAISDIQKNTLQVKVAIESPPPTLKPDMLVQVTFLAPAGDKPAETARQRLMIPQALVDSADGGASVWIGDQAAGVVHLSSEKLGMAVDGELVSVL